MVELAKAHSNNSYYVERKWWRVEQKRCGYDVLRMDARIKFHKNDEERIILSVRVINGRLLVIIIV